MGGEEKINIQDPQVKISTYTVVSIVIILLLLLPIHKITPNTSTF